MKKALLVLVGIALSPLALARPGEGGSPGGCGGSKPHEVILESAAELGMELLSPPGRGGEGESRCPPGAASRKR